MGRRITRKQLKENEFVSFFDSFTQWMSGNWRPFAAGLAGLVLIILLWAIVGWWTGSRSGSASHLLAQAVEAYQSEAANPAAGSGSATAEAKLREVVDRFGRTDQADVARLYLAQIDLRRGEVDEARTILVKLVDRNQGNALGRLAFLDLLHLRLASGQAAEVVTELEAMAAGTDQRLPQDAALYELGMAQLGEQKVDAAKASLQKLVEEFPDSAYTVAARQQLTALG